MPKKKWFKKAVEKRPPNNLGGWKKSLPANIRRRRALSSRPKNWTMPHRYLSAGRALQALANVTKDKWTRMRAIQDAKYFFKKAKEM
jgi:hypothetical protein